MGKAGSRKLGVFEHAERRAVFEDKDLITEGGKQDGKYINQIRVGTHSPPLKSHNPPTKLCLISKALVFSHDAHRDPTLSPFLRSITP